MHDRTYELWRSFMPVRKEIRNAVSRDLFSVQIYDTVVDFTDYKYDTLFTKWAAVEVPDFDFVPDGMSAHTITGGLYAVFRHNGPASEGRASFEYIFRRWLPASGYEVDQREHFEILGDQYKNNEPDSEEDIWIPVKRKQ